MFERICFILLINLVFFYRTLKLKYCSDDIPAFHNPPKFRNKLHKRFLWLIASLRINPQEDHALTTLLHALTAVFVYTALGHNYISFITAILFSFNPANNQCSIWSSGRGYVLTALCLMIAMTFQYLSPFFILLATTHPSGFFSPLAFLGSSKWYIVLPLPFFWWYGFKYMAKTVANRRAQEAVDEDKKFNGNKIVLAIKTYGFYATLCIIPFKITFYHSFLQSAAGSGKALAYKKDKFFYIGCTLLAYMLYSMFHWTAVSWGVLWYSICIAPYINLMRMNQEVAERYIYLPSIGLMFALANILIAYPLVVALVISSYMTRLWFIMPMYTDDYWLLEHAVFEDPGAWYAWHIRAQKRFNQGCIREALNMWVMAKMLSPKEFKLNINIGVILMMLKKHDEALKFFKIAEDNIVPGQEKMANQILKEAREGKMPICT